MSLVICPNCGATAGWLLKNMANHTYTLTCGCLVTRQNLKFAQQTNPLPPVAPSHERWRDCDCDACLTRPAPMRVEATYTEPITAWRGWKWTRIQSFDCEQVPELRSVGSNMPWLQRREAAAACTATSYSHEAPQPDCTCGIWSFKDRAKTEAALARYRPQGFVLGEVKLWGRIVETVNGYRAQYAYPKRLYVTDEELAVGLAERYGVPVEVEEAKEPDPADLELSPGNVGGLQQFVTTTVSFTVHGTQ